MSDVGFENEPQPRFDHQGNPVDGRGQPLPEMRDVDTRHPVPAPSSPSTALEVVDLGDDAGAGAEGMRLEEQLTPFLRILQAQSPQCVRGEPEYIEEARAGMIFDTATQECFDGEMGVEVVFCARDYHYGAWVPRDSGGGFRGMLSPDDPAVLKLKAVHGRFKKLPHVMPTSDGGTEAVELVETIQLYALYAPAPLDDFSARRAIVAFTSTAMPVAQGYLTRHNRWTYRVQQGEKFSLMPAQLWSYKWRLTTVSQSNASGRWFNWKIDLLPEGARPPADRSALLKRTDPLFALGREFYDLVKRGAVKPDYDNAGAGQAGGSDGDVPF